MMKTACAGVPLGRELAHGGVTMLKWVVIGVAGLSLGACVSEAGQGGAALAHDTRPEIRGAASSCSPATVPAGARPAQNCPDLTAGMEGPWTGNALPSGAPGRGAPAQAAAFAGPRFTGALSGSSAANEAWAGCVKREARNAASGPEPIDEAVRTTLARCLSEEMAVYGALGQQAPGEADAAMRRLQAMAEKTASLTVAEARRRAPEPPKPATPG